MTEAALRQVVGQRTIDEALTEGKLEIQEEILKQVQEVLDLYKIGVRVDQAKLQTVSVPQEVDHAFKDVANAREDKERLRNEAEAYRNDIIPKTRGEAERMIREAEAYKVERVQALTGRCRPLRRGAQRISHRKRRDRNANVPRNNGKNSARHTKIRRRIRWHGRYPQRSQPAKSH